MERRFYSSCYFGSRARGDARKESDIDIAVYYEGDAKERFRFRINVAGELPSNVDVHTFQDLPLYVIHQALREGKLLYVRGRDKTMRILLRASREAEDFSYRMRGSSVRRKIYLRELERSIKILEDALPMRYKARFS